MAIVIIAHVISLQLTLISLRHTTTERQCRKQDKDN